MRSLFNLARTFTGSTAMVALRLTSLKPLQSPAPSKSACTETSPDQESRKGVLVKIWPLIDARAFSP
jgi:hypothetical protein